MYDRIDNVFIIFLHCIELEVAAITSNDLDKLVKECLVVSSPHSYSDLES